MGKDKKKKNHKNEYSEIEKLKYEYENSLAMLRAKHEQFDGMLAEIKLRLKEIKDLKRQLQSLGYKDDNKEEEISL